MPVRHALPSEAAAATARSHVGPRQWPALSLQGAQPRLGAGLKPVTVAVCLALGGMAHAHQPDDAASARPDTNMAPVQLARTVRHIQPARLNLGLRYERGDWSAQLDVTHRQGKKARDVAVPSDPRAARTVFFRPGSSTTLDLGGQWRLWRHASGEVRLNAAVQNLTDRKYWRWNDVPGLSESLPTLDAYSQPGRTVSLAITATF